MDIFMDKLAQRVNAQEMIKANSEADTARMEELQTQVERYEAGLQEMENCNAKSAELSEEMKSGLTAMLGNMQGTMENLGGSVEKLDHSLENLDGSAKQIGELTQKLEEAAPQLPNKEEMAELFRQSDEFNHREDVKVYRNVQASIVEENEKQTAQMEQLVKASTGKLAGKTTAALVFSALAFIAAAGTLALQILQMLNFKLF